MRSAGVLRVFARGHPADLARRGACYTVFCMLRGLCRALRRIRLRTVAGPVVLATVVAVASCASPTLPLPPPAIPNVSTSPEAGKVRLVSTRGAEANAIIVVYNRNPNVPLDRRVGGTQADGVGTWQADVVAAHGDVLEVTQEFGSTRSTPTNVQVP